MKELHYGILLAILVGAISDGLFDLSEIKNKLLQWKTQKLAALCPSNGIQLQNLLNLVCSTAQPTNTTSRDACISCFSKLTTAPQGPQELNGLSVCATRYFTGSTYAGCAENLQVLASSALNVQTAGCYMGYCDFVKCLRRVNSQNLIIECTREARTGINIMMDADNLRFYTNVTSCILAKSRCGNFNPITGAPQIPGYMGNNIRVTNALQITAAGDLRVIAFSGNTKVAATFCTTSTNLTQTNWLTNVC
ncbi:uncharacterized protein LOC105388990 isoform X2 [Plutella xylostella]|uniref:uncharacterized protein LOC105388990 isoform X2 n=1 Tax=Plutella xylostella TaxID=51655 RepID=UPI0018D182BA|nr:uncharacterized protein LOC105388990 isoform X2 [Plutella xylostella]